MSDQQVRDQQFSYPSNQVIQREHLSRADEPTGEPESLAGRIDPRQMGSLVGREKPNIKQKQKVMEKLFDPKKRTKLHISGGNVITTDIDENLLYRPKTKENRLVYEKILSLIHNQMQEQPQEVIKSVVDEILAALKNENTKDGDKKVECECLLGKITNEFFSDLLLNTKLLTDYNPQVDDTLDRYEEEVRMPVLFDEEQLQEGESSDEAQVIDEGDEDSNDVEEEGEKNIKVKDMEIEGLEEVIDQSSYVNAVDIDAYWLHGQINQLYNDPIKTSNILSDVMGILNAASDIESENELVKLFGHDNFNVIRLLHNNRHKIYYCSRLKQTQSEAEKEVIVQEMQATEGGQQVLEQLQHTYVKKDGTKYKYMEEERKDDDLEKRLTEAINISDKEFQAISKKIIDLEGMTFTSQGHLMSNEKCTLPPGSYKISKKGYEEIHIPAIKQKVSKDKLVSVDELPTWAQTAFHGYKELNVIQSKVCDAALNHGDNLLICAPTGAGKTNVALLSMLQVIGRYIEGGEVDLSKFKIIYIAPMKALVNEQVLNFQIRLEGYKIKVAELTGDSHLTKQQIQQTQVLVVTPEKWDILTRKAQANQFLSLVKLIIIDEIHLLHDSRGPVLEAIVARTIRSVEERQEQIRIVGLSATLPNYSDVAAFIRVKPSGVFYFDNSYRPVPLQQQYIGVTEKKPIRRLLLLNEILYEKVSERAGKSQILVFVHSRKETVKAAKLLKETAFSKDELGKFLKDDSVSKKVIEEVLSKDEIRSPDLRELLAFGFGVHHAGLSRSDRDIVEQLFADKHIQVLISTSTLAWGVNLPAHTVIIKGTQIYSPEQGRWMELSPQDILQMMGRAGRPRYDTKGEGIILTTYQELKYYLSLLNMQLPIESQFVSSMADQLNAEVALGTVSTLKQAVNWIGYTYLYVRMLRNPSLYQIEETELQSDPLLVRRRADLAHSGASLLDKHGLIRYDRKTGVLESTVLGRIASFYYLKYPSVAVYNQHLKFNMGMIELFKIFSLSNEFKLIPIREEEKVELQRLAMSVPVPIKGSPEDPTTKVNVLLQAYISRLKLEGFALNSDMVYVTQSAGRIMRALYEICKKHEWAQSAMTALNLAKMVEQRMWGCMTPLRQFKGLPEEILKRIEKKEGISWEHLYSMSAQQIGELIRYQNLGKTVHKLIHKFPRVEIQAFAQPITRSCLRIDLQLTPDFQWDEKMHGKQEPFHIFVLDCDCEKILYGEQFTLKYKRVVQSESKSYMFSFTVPLFEIMHPIYFIKVVSDRWIACESEQAVPFKNLILPEPFLRVTELLGLSCLPLDALQFPQIERALQKKVLPLGTTHLDPVQTQVFANVYNSQDSIFIGCPSFQSKNLLPYIAVLQNVQLFKGEKCVYVAPTQRTCDMKFRDFVQIFSKSGVLHLKIGMLTGQINKDSKILETSDIIVSTAQNWDIMSRRWRIRKGFQQIRLFIADDLHLLGENGAILEVIVSRMRMISAQTERPVRIVGLAISVADYREIGEWIGATPQNTISFSPTARANPVQILIQSFDQSHRPTRINAMLKQMYPTLCAQSKELTIIYVSDRKQARLCALDLMTLANADNTSFLNADEKDVKPLTEQVRGDQYLQYTLATGIGFLYECMDVKDEEIVLNLIKINVCNVIFITHKLALHYNLKAKTVIIFDNYKYDGLDKRYVDYSIPEVLEMVESAGSNEKDGDPPRCLVLVHTPKKDFFKKFLFEPLPVESHMNHYMANHLNAEIVAKNITTTQDCIDWLTWSFMYRRLTQNPNYYNLSEISGAGVNNYLSELIENTIEELQEARCIVVEESDLDAINSGIIANYYYINVQTVAHFCQLIQDKSKLKDLIFCLSQAQEFDVTQVRNSEELILSKIARQINYTPQNAKLNEPNTKTFILLQAYFHRIPLNSDLKYDLNEMLDLSVRLCTAMVDVASSNLWLRPAIQCMQLCQMLIQATWVNSDSPLKQLPFFDDALILKLREHKVEDIADLMNMEDVDREKYLGHFDQQQVELIAKACNRYPSVEIKQIISEEAIAQNEVVNVQIILERQGEDYTDFVIAPHYPKPKEEQWWILCADRKSNKLFGNKKITLKDIAKVDLRFQAPEPGVYEMTIYAICDSYVGADQIQTFNIKILPPIEPEEIIEEEVVLPAEVEVEEEEQE